MSQDTRTRMRAISPQAWGAPAVLTEVEVDRPTPGPTEVLVRVHAAGVNPVDWKSRSHGGFGLWGAPPILGYDVSGVVEAVGLGVRVLQVGDEVFGMPHFPHQAGGYAEYVTGAARRFAPKPTEIDHVRAAALPLAALTAWQALTETAQVRAGQRVLIHAAAGGVGHLAVQIAKASGAYVIGTARASKHAFLRSLGADEVIDYTAAEFTDATGDIDVVVDPVGGDYGPRSLRVMRAGATLVSLASPAEDHLTAQAAALGVQAGFMLVEPDHAGMKAIAAMVTAGHLHPEIDSVFPLEQAAKAHELGETGRTRGKIVLTVAG